MIRQTFRGIFGGLLIPFFVVTGLAQGLSFEILEGKNQSDVDKGTYMPGMFREEGKDGTISILRLDKELMITLTPSKKTYTEMTFAQLGMKIKQSHSKLADAMNKRMEGMPPDQRKKMAEQMAALTGKHDEVKVDVVPTGQQKTVGEYRCTGYTLRRNGKDVETIWASKDVPNYASVRKDFQRISALFTSIGVNRNVFASMEKVDGFPIERSGTGISEKITKIQAGSFPMSSFEVPAGYSREKSELEKDTE
jgi:hypothetical protein